ncbi:MAG: PAS domain S-box protein [Melioribacteraceae bacterium]
MKNNVMTKKDLIEELEKLRAENDRLKLESKITSFSSGSEGIYKQLFENNPHPMWVFEIASLRFLAVNDAAIFKYGFSREEFLSMTIADIRPKEDVPKLLNNISEPGSGFDDSEIWRHRIKDGRIIDVEIISHTLKFNGKEAVLIVAHDITEKRQVEAALKLSEIRFRGLINSMQDLVYTLDCDMKITGLYGMWSEMYGLTEELLLGRKLTAFLSPKEARINDESNIKALGGESVKFEWSLNFNNDRFYFESSLSPLFGKENQITGIVGVAREITERKNYEFKLKESEERYRNLFEFSPDPILLHLKGKILFINSLGVGLLGAKERNEIVGRYIYDFIRPDYHELVRTRLEALDLSVGKLPVVQEKFVRLDKSVIDVEVSTIAFLLDGEIAAQVVIRDISDKIRAQRQIQLQARLLNSARDSIFLISEDGEIVYANDAAILSHGYTDEEFLNMKIQDLDFGQSSEMVTPRIKEIHEKGSGSFELMHKRKDGSVFPVEVSAQSITIDNEKYILSVNRDITERIETHTALIQSEGKFRSIFETATVAILILGLDHKIIQANNAFAKMLGYTNEEVIGRSILELTHQEDRYDSSSKLGGIIHKSDKVGYLEKRYYHKNGEIVWGIASGTVVKDEKGHPLYVVGLIQDITDRVLANQQIRKISQAVEQSPASIVITDLSGSIEYVNPKFTEVTGYTFEEAIGQNPRVLKSGSQSKEFYKEMWKTISAGNEWQGEFHNKKKSGELYWEHASISPIKDERGRTTHFLAVKEDITDWKNIQEELIRSREEAIEASKLKSSLLANMSHEFRTPLNGILGFSQLLKDDIVEKDHLDMIAKIIQSGKRLMNTLNSVLTITELENNEFLISKSEIELSLFCRQIKNLFAKPATDKNLEFTIDVKDESIIVVTDENLLTKILVSIVDNAIKYTQQGEIKVELKCETGDDGNGFALISVIDTGIGIRAEDQSIIFREFKQLSEGFRRDFEGLGLGLTMASKMVKLIGGTIEVVSNLGAGSKFTVRLPFKSSQSTEIKSAETAMPPKELSVPAIIKPKNGLIDVLLIEDNQLNVEVVQRFLSKMCRVSFAKDGKSAIEMAGNNDYALLMIDINLGHGMDGVQVLKEIKKLDGYKSKPVIALTGYASDANKKDFLSQGFTHYLAKPFEKKDLISIIERITKRV